MGFMSSVGNAVKRGVKMTVDPTSIPSGGKKGALLGLWGMNEKEKQAGGGMDPAALMAMMGGAGAMGPPPLQPGAQPGQLAQALGPMAGSLMQQAGPPPGQVANTPVPDMMEYMRILQGQRR